MVNPRTTPHGRGKGWVRDLPDHRDHRWSAPRKMSEVPLPDLMDLRSAYPGWARAISDQGQLGSCTSNAINGAVRHKLFTTGHTRFSPSRLFIYYEERKLEGTVDWDSGATIRDGMRAISNVGMPSEADWPYDIARFTEEPSAKAYHDAPQWKVSAYAAAEQDLFELRATIAAGEPVVFGFATYENFDSYQVAEKGILDLPSPDDGATGGHAVVLVGYSHPDRRFIVRNSYGPRWGRSGYFTMPYDYVLNPDLADDFWVVKSIVNKR